MSIVLEGLTKRYEGHPVVNQVHLEVAEGEFFVLLGPSGSGKTTVLRMIAGLSSIDQGRVLLHGRDVSHLPVQRRGVGFVFQQYALFRHMTVAENVEFGLSIRKVGAAERRRRRDELLEVVGLAGLGGRLPYQLSGGQQQRVALARALAHRPDVLLLDEPFGALDAKIRAELRRVLKRVQREFRISALFVTHDQEEGFELADRMGVMNYGRLLEVGAPEELYHRPATEFVATFLGTANLLVGNATEEGIRVGPLRFPLATEPSELQPRRRVQVLFRPEDVQLAPFSGDLSGPPLGEGLVEQSIFSGGFERLRLKLPSLTGVRPIAPPTPFGADSLLVDAVRPQDSARRFPLRTGDLTWVGVRRIHALTHPGLNFLCLFDGTPESLESVAVGGAIARLSHARVTLLGVGREAGEGDRALRDARERLGPGLAALELRSVPDAVPGAVGFEVERGGPYDLVVTNWGRERKIEVLQALLETGEHHLLLVRAPRPAPQRVLICVAVGEPGKEDVQFAARLIRHLGATGTLLSVLPPEVQDPVELERAERFLAAGARSTELLGVAAKTRVRRGGIRGEIAAEMASGSYDMLVVGAPLTPREGRIRLSGVVAGLLEETGNVPVLIVRSPYTAPSAPGKPA
jgi:sulfate/thiosulfate transport system ATP-binding protein